MTPARVLIAALIFITTTARTEEPVKDLGPFAWLPAFLDTHSSVEIALNKDQPRETISTRCNEKLHSGALVIEYKRMTYGSETAATLERHQRIFYNAPLADIDPNTVKAQVAGESSQGVQFWMVSFNARPEPQFFGYDNMVEHYGETNTPQVFNSHGKVRQIILGYLTDEKRANELAEKFSASLKAALEAKHPDQSAA